MATTTVLRLDDVSRRRLVLQAGALLVAASAAGASSRPARANVPARDVENLVIGTVRRAALRESAAHLRYVAYARRADADGYPGVAYLFTALGTSELIHAQNYNRLLAMVGEKIIAGAPAPERVGATKSNLIAAAKAEIASIESFYPSVLEQLGAPNAATARQDVLYSWGSHKQHRRIIEKILDYAPVFFEVVASRINDETERFHVCGICGSTVYKLPKRACEICGHPVSHYREIAPRAFLDKPVR